MRKALGSTLAIGFVAALLALARRSRPRAGRATVRLERDGAGKVRLAPGAGSGADADPSDDELLARVRARVAIPADVEVVAQDGAVVLFGRVPRYLVGDLLARVAAVDGVAAVEDRLTPVDFVAPERPPGPPDPP